MKNAITILMALIFLASMFASVFSKAAEPKESFVMGDMNPPMNELQIETARLAALPIAEAYAQTGIPEFRLRDVQGWKLTTLDPRKTDHKSDFQVIQIGRKNGVIRTAVRGPVYAVAADGTVKGVSSFRVLMDVSPDAKLVGQAEVNLFSNLLTSDNGRWFPLNPESRFDHHHSH